MKKNLGLALIIGGVGYVGYRLYNANKAGLATDAAFKILQTSGLYPSIGAVVLGAYLRFA